MTPRPGLRILRQTLDRRTFTLTDSSLERRFLPIARRVGLTSSEDRRDRQRIQGGLLLAGSRPGRRDRRPAVPPHPGRAGEGSSPRPGPRRRGIDAPAFHPCSGAVRAGPRGGNAGGRGSAAVTGPRFVANSARRMTDPEERDGQGHAPVLSEEPLENSSGARRGRRGRAPERSAGCGADVVYPGAGEDARLRPRHRQALLRLRLRPDRRAGRRARRAAHLVSRDGRADPGPVRRREDPRLQGLPRAAQRRARSLQGRPALPPRRRPRRGPCARDADDLEDGDRRDPVRRRQGRRQLPQRSAEARGAAVHHALADGQDRQGARPEPRHHGARRRHERAGDGLADGRVRQAPRPHAGDRDRQADRRSRAPTAASRPPAAASSTCTARRLPSSVCHPAPRPSSCRGSATSAPGRRGSSSSSA